jgi:hypothetical protein
MREDENKPQLDLTACSDSVYVLLASNVLTIDDATVRQLDKNKRFGVRKSEVGKKIQLVIERRPVLERSHGCGPK